MTKGLAENVQGDFDTAKIFINKKLKNNTPRFLNDFQKMMTQTSGLYDYR